MCAIIGILGNTLPEKELCIKARDAMTHRGPDDAGVYYDEKEGVALGHRRLSIIDLSSAGRQPMFSHDKKYVITFNGEIYNFKALREELKKFYPFQTQTDTEVILAAYSKWDIDCLKKLQGMFAFVLWDREKDLFFVTRDQLGIKPLFWSFYKNNFYCASEIKGILIASGMPRKLEHQSIPDYLNYRYPLGEKTFFEEINALLPGHYMLVRKGVLPHIKKYWELPVVLKKEDPGEEIVLKETEELLKKTVQSHMISDVPLGAYLSGGLDSSVLVALMSHISPQKVKTFSVGFSEEKFNELKHARKVSDILKTDHHELKINAEEYMSLLPGAIRYKDTPLHVPNEVVLLALSRELKKHITVVLSGEGADELFGGYGRVFRSGFDFDVMNNSARFPEFTAHDQEILLSNMREKYDGNVFSEAVDHLLFQYPYAPYETTRSLLSRDIFPESKEVLLNREYIKKELERGAGLSTCEQYMHFFQRIHLLGILGRLDNSSMGASVEGRVPFIDHRFVEHVSALPLHYKMKWKSKEDEHASRLLNSDQISDIHDTTKYLLRKIGSRYLPEDVINRKKFSFLVPLDEWFGGNLKESAHEILLSSDASSSALYNRTALEKWLTADGKKEEVSSSSRGRDIWALLNIELWMKEYGVTL